MFRVDPRAGEPCADLEKKRQVPGWELELPRRDRGATIPSPMNSILAHLITNCVHDVRTRHNGLSTYISMHIIRAEAARSRILFYPRWSHGTPDRREPSNL